MYVISYDISSDRLRRKISKTLEGYGKRVQYSVFECEIEKKRYDRLYEKLCKLTESITDGNIKIYTVCENCKAKITVIGVPDISDKYKNEEVIVI